VDISYINVAGTFYYLCSVLDGCSRYLVHGEVRPSMTEAEVETILQRGRERFPEARPRIISDNGPQFIARDFKEFIRICGMTHVRTSPYYPQSNGKIERWHKTLKGDAIRPRDPAGPGRCPTHRLEVHRRIQRRPPAQRDRLHHARPTSWPASAAAIFAERARKLTAARLRRRASRDSDPGIARPSVARPLAGSYDGIASLKFEAGVRSPTS
jgi:putative transposase